MIFLSGIIKQNFFTHEVLRGLRSLIVEGKHQQQQVQAHQQKQVQSSNTPKGSIKIFRQPADAEADYKTLQTQRCKKNEKQA